MKKIRLDYVGDITSNYPYLECFLNGSQIPFLDVGITENRQLSFKFYASQTDILLDVDDWTYILSEAKDFLTRSLKNEDDFLNLIDE